MKKSEINLVQEDMNANLGTLHPVAFTAARRALSVIKLMADSDMEVPNEEVDFMKKEIDENIRRLNEVMDVAPEKGKRALQSGISALEFMRSKIDQKKAETVKRQY